MALIPEITRIGQGEKAEIGAANLNAAQLKAEADDLKTYPERSSEAMEALFPTGIPEDASFYDRLHELEVHLGFSEETSHIIGILWSEAFKKRPAEINEKTLSALLEPNINGFFSLLRSLKYLLSSLGMRTEFALKWIPAIIHRIGRDMAGGPLWDALSTFSEEQSEIALDIMRGMTPPKNETEISIAALILGTTRISSSRSDKAKTSFEEMERAYIESETPEIRMTYFRSWLSTAQKRTLTSEELGTIAKRAESPNQNERDEAFWFFTRIICYPKIDANVFDFAVAWLRSNASPNISEASKHHVVDAASTLRFNKTQDLGDLILLVQPLPSDNAGTWREVETYLVSLLEANKNGFETFFLSLAEKCESNLLKVLQKPHGFEWLISELRKVQFDTILGKLLISPDRNRRQLGLYLFDELNANVLPQIHFEKATEDECQLLFYELQLFPIQGRSTARLLISILPRLEVISNFGDILYDELLFQAKNLPGGIREELILYEESHPVLKKVHLESEQYFSSISQAGNASISQMQIQGYQHATRLYGRKFASQISKSVEENSLFHKLGIAKQVQLLYGEKWRTYHAHHVGEASGFAPISHSIEVPRLEEIDPETIALRRLDASRMIRILSSKRQST